MKEPRSDMKKRTRSSPGKAGADAQPRTGACADAATQETPTPAGQTHEHIARRVYALYEAAATEARMRFSTGWKPNANGATITRMTVRARIDGQCEF